MGETCWGCGVELPPSRGAKPRKWCSQRCRKAGYGQPCVDCGARTSYGAESRRVAEPRCRSCAYSLRVTWTEEMIVDAIERWVLRYGSIPAKDDWNTWEARNVCHDEERAQRFEEGDWPHFGTVVRRFGSWNVAIRAAGYKPRAPHGGGGNSLRRRDVKQHA